MNIQTARCILSLFGKKSEEEKNESAYFRCWGCRRIFAWYLAEAGYEVTVIDRAEGVAMETSFANAGQLSYGYTTPWAAPGIPTKALKWLFKSHPPLLFRPDGSLYQIEWLWQMLQNCTAARYQINKERMVRISEYSREMFRRFEAQTGMNFEGRKKGTLQIFRQAKEVEAAEQDIAVLERYGVPYRRLKPEECAEFEPALARVTAKIAGGRAPACRRDRRLPSVYRKSIQIVSGKGRTVSFQPNHPPHRPQRTTHQSR